MKFVVKRVEKAETVEVEIKERELPKKISVRVSREEAMFIVGMEKITGMSRTEVVRKGLIKFASETQLTEMEIFKKRMLAEEHRRESKVMLRNMTFCAEVRELVQERLAMRVPVDLIISWLRDYVRKEAACYSDQHVKFVDAFADHIEKQGYAVRVDEVGLDVWKK